tara:strand:- start:539 stop:1270 length:732 start_codon:yes stop_codon:yes gene_type:complete
MLLVDIGNTNIVYALYDGNNYILNKRMLPKNNLEYIMNELSHYTINYVAIASVVPNITNQYLKQFKEKFNIEPFVVSYKNANIKLIVDSNKEVGPDRICNVKAAIKKTDKNCIVIDFGTATTYDVINDKKEFIGGAIAPGIQVSGTYLIEKAALLQNTALEFPEKYIGKNTKTNIQSGIMYGALNSIEGMVKNIKKELNHKSDIILTGGFSQLISSKLSFQHKLEPNLTIEGIKLIFEENLYG